MKRYFNKSSMIAAAFFLGHVSFAGAQTDPESEFEKGYRAGRGSCHVPTEAWFCTIPQGGSCGRSSGQGGTRAQALLEIGEVCLKEALEYGVRPECTKL